MVNPILTAVFDTFLIGSAGAIVAAMVEEYRDARRAPVGAADRPLRRVPARHSATQDVQRFCGNRQRRFRLSVG